MRILPSRVVGAMHYRLHGDGAALGVRQPRDKKFEMIVLEELPPDFLQDVLDPKASWTDDVLADEGRS